MRIHLDWNSATGCGFVTRVITGLGPVTHDFVVRQARQVVYDRAKPGHTQGGTFPVPVKML
jgi:hypothetical protein